jgi:hypothetical protein
MLTEAVAYVGAVLVIAGVVAAFAQDWEDLAAWQHVAVLGTVAAFFLAVGLAVRRIAEPAAQRLVGVVWLLSVLAFGATVQVLVFDVYGVDERVTALTTGAVTTAYAAALWLGRRRALQQVAMFAGVLLTVSGTVVTVYGADETSPLAFALPLWALGLAWAVLGWRRYLEPVWVAIPLGVVLALVAPSLAVESHGWIYAVGVVTAAAVMAAGVRLQATALLALGAVGLFGYLTALVVRYFGESLGVPATLSITGALILVVAAVSARLVRATRPPHPKEPPKTEQPPEQHLPKAS